MMNMQNMMKQAQKLQKQMEQSQAELAASQFVGKSAQDLVVATLTGDKKVVSIEFNPAVVDPEDTETLADMTVQAINAAIEEIDAATKKKLGAFAGKLPFYADRERGWDKSPSLSIVFGLTSKTQWLSGLYYADFINFYSLTQLCGGGTTKSNSSE